MLTSILFDQFGYMATSCDDTINKLFLNYANGSYTGKNISTTINPSYFGFDSKGHFVQISFTKINIYNN